MLGLPVIGVTVGGVRHRPKAKATPNLSRSPTPSPLPPPPGPFPDQVLRGPLDPLGRRTDLAGQAP
ncbi:hypothetical protein AB0A19_36250, partial [Streptomyces lydicus]